MSMRICGIQPVIILLTAVLAAPVARAAGTNQVKPPEKKEAAEKKPHAFRGKLNGVNQAAKTISVGKSTYYVTTETRIQRADKPAKLEDAVIGESVRGYARPGAEGRMLAVSLAFGPKGEKKKRQ